MAIKYKRDQELSVLNNLINRLKKKIIKLKNYSILNKKETHDITLLNENNPKIIRKRSTLSLETEGNNISVYKKFHNTPDGKNSFFNEKRACKIFGQYNWFPKIIEMGDDFIRYKYIPNEYRLDQLSEKLNIQTRFEIFNKIILVIIDLYSNNIAHRDIHAKNLFYFNHNVILIDYEVIGDLDPVTDLFDSYDISGLNLDTPLSSGNMHLLNSNQFAIINNLNIKEIKNIEDIKKAVNRIIFNQLQNTNTSFFTRKNKCDGRHIVLQNKIYSSYDLKYTKIYEKHAQRDIKKRLKLFNLDFGSIEGKKILDVGSHTGGLVFELSKHKPSYIVGLEYDADKVLLSRVIHAVNCKNVSIEFINVDVEDASFMDNFNDEFDFVFCLALLGHIRDKKKLLSKLFLLTKSYLFFEGNGNTNVQEIFQLLSDVGFTNVHYAGISSDEALMQNNIRPMFIANK